MITKIICLVKISKLNNKTDFFKYYIDQFKNNSRLTSPGLDDESYP